MKGMIRLKNYTMHFLYDNGQEESFQTGLISEEELGNVLKFIATSFEKGLNAYLQFPNEYGLATFIDLRKVTRVKLLEEK